MMYSGPRRDQGMRQNNNNNNNNNKRMRGRNRKGPNPLTRSYESNGPDVKIRGTALHVAEKYGQLARDAHSSGDRVAAENYYQHAEHYYRIIAAAQAQMPFPQQVYRNDDSAADEGEEHGFGQRPNPNQQPQMQGRPENYQNGDQPGYPADVQPPYGGNGQQVVPPDTGGGEQPQPGENFDDSGEEEQMHGGAQNSDGGGRDQQQFRRRRRPYRGGGGGGGRPDNREGNFNPGGGQGGPSSTPGSDE
jgi:hypothetical protein